MQKINKREIEKVKTGLYFLSFKLFFKYKIVPFLDHMIASRIPDCTHKRSILNFTLTNYS